MKLPALMLYPGDWLRDQVSGCSLAAQGLWLRMMFLAHDSERYGYLCQNGVAIPPEHIARRCGTPLEQYASLLTELDRAGIPSRTPEGTIYSRRMVRDAKERAGNALRQSRYRARNGPVTPRVTPLYEGEGEVENPPRERGVGERETELPSGFPGTVEDALTCAGFVGCNPEFTAKAWNKAMSRNGTDAKGQPIRSFRHFLAAEWAYEQDRLAREKPVNGQPANGSHVVVHQKEYDRVIARMATIKSTYGDHQTWSELDRNEFNKLRDRKRELKTILGITV